MNFLRPRTKFNFAQLPKCLELIDGGANFISEQRFSQKLNGSGLETFFHLFEIEISGNRNDFGFGKTNFNFAYNIGSFGFAKILGQV